MTNLVIVESPAKKSTIEKYLGDGWKVEASFGHIRDLPNDAMGIDFDNFQPNYVATERGGKTISKLKNIAKDADDVYLATDLDREGEAISWHLAEVLSLKNPKRITFNEITKKAVTEAVNNPRTIDYDLFYAQQGRRVADRLVGWRVSPELNNSTGMLLSAGRVQSPAVRLIVEREREIHNFKSTKHYGVMLRFITDNFEWSADWDTTQITSEHQPYVLFKDTASTIALTKNVTIVCQEQKLKKVGAPAPFITTTLQKAGNIALKITPKQTMKAAQDLFDKGLITYHRTDNPNLSDDAIELIKIHLSEKGYEDHISEKPNTWKSKADAQEAHEAIRPTDFNLDIESEIDDKTTQLLFKMIRMRALLSQMKAAEYQVKTIHLESEKEYEVLDEKKARFIAKGSVLQYEGWKSFGKDEAEEEQKKDSDSLLPPLNDGNNLSVTKGEVVEKKTKAPKRYTQPSLIAKLEKEGIGRPSTYATIIENIERREYVQIKKNQYYALKAGEIVVDTLVDRFKFMDLSFTRILEKGLDKIAKGELEYKTLMSALDSQLLLEIEELKNNPLTEAYSCPKCGERLRQKTGKNGVFWGCSSYNETGCDFIAQDENGKPLEQPSEIPACPDCTSPMKRIKGKKGFFWGCTNYSNGCKKTMDDKDGQPVEHEERKVDPSNEHLCPKCQHGLNRISLGNNKYFWGCSNYKSGGCDFSTDDNNGKPAVVYDCPDCGKKLRQGTKKNSKVKNWYCSGYKDGCKFNTDDKDGQPVIEK